MKISALLLVSLLLPAPACAQLVEDLTPSRGNCCLAAAAQTLATELMDWNQMARYHADNEALKRQPADPQRVVFMGDSITDGWKLPQYFPGKPYVNRGIGGQTTPQMLNRMFEDVIDLKPAVVAIFAGTNDIARNTGPETLEMVEENFQAMTELAQLHGIRVILCSITPVSDYGPRKMTDARPLPDIVRLNLWLRDYAAKTHSVFADYYKAAVDEKGMFKDGYTREGLHPNDKGYELMAPVISAAIEQALRK